MKRAVFLDRDGVLNMPLVRDGKAHSPRSVAELEIVPGAAAALEKLKRAGYLLVMISNQPEIARGTLTLENLEAMNGVMRAALPLDDVFLCRHDDSDGCDCRKPKPGMLREAAAKHGIDLGQSWMVGDRWRDVDAGAAAGCRTVLIDWGYNEQAPRKDPDGRVGDLAGAVRFILGLDE